MKITKKLVAALFCVVLAIALCIPALTAVSTRAAAATPAITTTC